MATRIAVIADVHLPEAAASAQEAAFEDALGRLRAERPDVLLLAGDATACGSAEAANRVRVKLDESGLCYRAIPGNADRRTAADLDATTTTLTIDHPFRNSECVVCLVDMRDGELTAKTREHLHEVTKRVDHLPVVLAGHYPMEHCLHDPGVRAIVASGRAVLLIGAHCHEDRHYSIQGIPAHTIRGLDPDKAIGAPPATALFELAGREWIRSDLPFDGGTVESWSAALRQEFIEHLGFSCMTHSLEGLASASALGVTCVELKAEAALPRPRGALVDAVQRWRDSGGRYLSIHLPDPRYDVVRQSAADVQPFQEAVSLASALKAEHLTVHVPRVPAGLMQPGGAVWAGCVRMFLKLLDEPMHSGTVIGIENLHMNPGEAADESRGFGYLPTECVQWVSSLRSTGGHAKIGVHLDIGHARNNAPFSEACTLGQWYALVGAQIVGFHLHQVVLVDGVMRNHYPIVNVYGPLISLSSLLWGWKRDRLSHAPMFLEIRGDCLEHSLASMQVIRRYVQGA